MPEFPTVAAHLHRVFSTGFYPPSADFDYQVRGLLGSVAYGGAETGEILATIDRVADNDHEHWFRAWSETADRIHAEAETASAAGHMVTAAQKYLRAANYFAVAVDAVSGLGDDTALLFAFRSHRSCWDAFVDTTDRIVERVQIPYETTALPGYFFAPSWEAAARPTLVMVNGSDGGDQHPLEFGSGRSSGPRLQRAGLRRPGGSNRCCSNAVSGSAPPTGRPCSPPRWSIFSWSGPMSMPTGSRCTGSVKVASGLHGR